MTAPRLAALPMPLPVGDGCEVSFEMISFTAATLRDLRGGE